MYEHRDEITSWEFFDGLEIAGIWAHFVKITLKRGKKVASTKKVENSANSQPIGGR